MKIKRIAAICKSQKKAELWTRPDHRGEVAAQYILAGRGVYRLQGMPVMEAEHLLGLFDIPGKDRDDWQLENRLADDTLCNLADTENGEKEADLPNIIIQWRGESYRPVITCRGLAVVNTEYFSPLDTSDGHFAIMERVNAAGKVYLAAKVGLILQAAIFPEEIPEGMQQEISRTFGGIGNE